MDSTLLSTLVLGGVGSIVTYYYSRQSKQLAHDQMMKELFADFNTRYSKLNNALFEIEEKYKSTDQLNRAPNATFLKQTVLDYFNLCAEEFYWYYHKGRIDKIIWNSWHSGMIYWHDNVEAIRDMWKAEVEANGKSSYYIIDEKEFFVK